MNPANSPALACLHIAFPRSLEEDVLDVCRAVPEVPGFTVLAADGFGPGSKLNTVRETVLGRAQRRLLLIVADPAVCASVIAALREALPNPEIAFWILPVTEFGRLA